MVTVLDSFEDGDLSEYSGDTESFNIVSTPTYDGGNALEGTGFSAITRTDQTISPGDTPFGAALRSNFNATYGDFGNACFVFGVESESGDSNLSGYVVQLRAGDNELRFNRFDSGDLNKLASTSAILSTGEYYDVEISQWTDGGDITAEVTDDDGVIQSVSVVDDTYGEGGYGWQARQNSFADDPNFDYAYKKEPLQPPTNVQIIDNTTEDELTLDWDEVSNASGYYVYLAQSSGSTKSDYTQVADVSSPPYTDTSLEDGERYYYRISSYSEQSYTISFVTQPAEGESIFQGSSFGNSSGSATIELESNLQESGGGVSGETFTYEVYQSGENPNTNTPEISQVSESTESNGDAHPASPIRTGGLTAGTDYFFYLKYVVSGSIVAEQTGNTWTLTGL